MHAQCVRVGEGSVLADEEVPLVIEQRHGVLTGQLPVEPWLHLEWEARVDLNIVTETESGLHRHDAEMVGLVEAGGVAACAAGILFGSGVGRRAVSPRDALGRSPQWDLCRCGLAHAHRVQPPAELLHFGRRRDILVRDCLQSGGVRVEFADPQLLVVRDGWGLVVSGGEVGVCGGEVGVCGGEGGV